MKEDIEHYTNHLEEVRVASGYIQESALELIDVELTAYQAYYKDLQERNGHFITFIIFLFITTIALAIFFAIWFSTGITSPLHKLYPRCKGSCKGELLGQGR